MCATMAYIPQAFVSEICPALTVATARPSDSCVSNKAHMHIVKNNFPHGVSSLRVDLVNT